MKWCKFCELSTRLHGTATMCRLCWRKAHANKKR